MTDSKVPMAVSKQTGMDFDRYWSQVMMLCRAGAMGGVDRLTLDDFQWCYDQGLDIAEAMSELMLGKRAPKKA